MKKDNGFLFTRGYSFVEMTIVMVIIFIIVMAAVTAYMNLRAKTRNVTENGIIAALKVAINSYYSKYATYPKCPPFLSCAGGGSSICTSTCTSAQAQDLMKYPPDASWLYVSADHVEWAIGGGLSASCPNNCLFFQVRCPHADGGNPPTKGYVWYYFPTNPIAEPWAGAGTNLAGKVLLYPGSPGH